MNLKQQSNLKYIFKIHSSKLKRANWSLNLTIEEAKKNSELISLTDSQTFRFIQDIKKYEINNSDVELIKKAIKHIKRLPSSIENKQKIKSLYNQKNEILFTKDYISIIMDRNKDFDRCNNVKNGIFINGRRYKRLLGTTGGIKNSTIIYVAEDIRTELNDKIDNGRDKKVILVPAKLEAYKALSCSSSTPVSNPRGVLVIEDGITEFTDDIITIDDRDSEYPQMKPEKDYPIKLQFCDGCSMVLPTLSKRWAKELGEELKEDEYISGYCIRNSWCKGMSYTFDYLDFGENVAHSYIVKDVWGNDIDIRNVELILTTNMLKLWDCYSSVEDYLKNCEENGYTFSVAKVCPKELENERNTNYQFLQSYNFSDSDIDELIKPTVNEIHEVLGEDYRKTLLFLKGIHMTDKNAFLNDNNFDIVKALTIDGENMIKDPYVKQRVHSMIEKRIKEAKIGVLKVKANYQVVSGDLYAQCQYMFGLKVTGLLKKEEYYSRTWLDKGVNQVVAFRAPMTCHNNIRVMNFVDNEEVRHWYKYMTTCIILNAWDTTTQAMNGEDFDADANISVDNNVLFSNTRRLPTLLCMQKSAIKKVVNESDLVKANKAGFGDDIGTTTNRITSMIEVLAGFKEDSEEYKELMYRIQCGQHFQQCAIDKTKGIISKSMPKEWYEYKVNKIDEDNDSEEIKAKKLLNLRILANKKPYFFIYLYPRVMNTYKTYINNTSEKCLMEYGVTINELKNKKNKTLDEKSFLEYYDSMMPVGTNPCVMNRICWKLEKEFDGFLTNIKDEKFDYSILKSNVEYSDKDFNAISNLYKEYNRSISQYAQTIKNEKVEKDEKKIRREIFKQNFKQQAYERCSNKDELCDIVIDLCYSNNRSKQFAWDIVGDVIIQNLLKRNNYKIKYPILEKDGDIKFGGYSFIMQEQVVNKEDYE